MLPLSSCFPLLSPSQDAKHAEALKAELPPNECPTFIGVAASSGEYEHKFSLFFCFFVSPLTFHKRKHPIFKSVLVQPLTPDALKELLEEVKVIKEAQPR